MTRILTVGEMMTTGVKALHEDVTVTSANWEMTFREFHHLPVVDATGKLVGMISDRDVLRALQSRRGASSSIGEIMARDVVVVTVGSPALVAVEGMLRTRCHALPVVDDRHNLVGIVTSTDFLELARRTLEGRDANTPHARA